MEPEAAFVLGALVTAVKGIGIAAVGAGIAWWRAGRRVRELEAQLAAAAVESPSMAQLAQAVEYLSAQVERLSDDQRELTRRLTSGGSD